MAISNGVIKEQKLKTNLQANLEEAYDYIHELESDCRYLESENRYLSDFIRYKGLTEEFADFKDLAHLDENEDLPFPHYVL